MMVIATKELTKKEQLRIVFRAELTKMLHSIEYNHNETEDEVTFDETVNILLKEVSIRTPL